MQKISRMEWVLLMLISITLIVICFVISSDYGASWDEPSLFHYARQSANAYLTIFNGEQRYAKDDIMTYYGPAFLIFADRVVYLLQQTNVVANDIAGWHLVNFTGFTLGLWPLYFMTRRWLNREASISVILLMATQPVIWGHALVNPKDIPFMYAYNTALYFGLCFIDTLPSSFIILSPTYKFGQIEFFTSMTKEHIRAIVNNKYFWLASIALGLTISIRVSGLAVGCIVGVWAWHKHGLKPVFRALEFYALLAILIMFITWPFLWDAPIHNFATALHVMTNFSWEGIGMVLFDGKYYPPAQLPGLYLITLLSIQLTEPVLALVVLGAIVLLYHYIRFRAQSDFLFIFGLWFLLPFAWAMTGRAKLYDNFRQMLFILPPLFILAGYGIEQLLQWMRPRATIWIISILILPGIFGLVTLHPYEYMYYNSLVGGIHGAFRRFEMDYWGLSTREVASYMDQYAPNNSAILTYGPNLVAREYLRPDLTVYSLENPLPSGEHHFYVFLPSRWDLDQRLFSDAPVKFTIQKEGVVLMIVKEVSR